MEQLRLIISSTVFALVLFAIGLFFPDWYNFLALPEDFIQPENLPEKEGFDEGKGILKAFIACLSVV